MTELQMGLIGLGATAVVGVFGYNKWQEYRHRKLAEAMLKPHHDDVLLGGGAKVASKAPADERNEPEIRGEAAATPLERREPVFVDRSSSMTAADDDDFVAVDEELSGMAPAAVAALPEVAEALPEAAPAGPVPAELLDPGLEFVVAMELVEPVAAQQILRSQRDALLRLSKPVHWVGYNERTREWESLALDSSLELRALRVGLQLVNRSGPVSGGDLTLFGNAMHALADELMAVVDMPSTRGLEQAAEIDRFCAEVDLEIGINLVSRGTPFTGTKIRALAEAAGMVLGIDGLFTRYDDAGRVQFRLQNYEGNQFTPDAIRSLTTHGLTFLLDVPRVDHGERVFIQMADLAKRFADTLQGALVDDNRQPLSDAQLEHIRREFIGKPQATMAIYGLPAGSPQALRLFS